MPRLDHIQVLPPLKRVYLQGSSRPSPSSSHHHHHQLQVKPRRRHGLAPHFHLDTLLPSSYIFSPSIRPRNSPFFLFFSTSPTYSTHFNSNPTETVNMSLSSKLSITDVDVKDKRVLIRVS